MFIHLRTDPEILTSSLKKLCEKAVSLGAEEAKPIRTNIIFVRDWVHLKCQYGCGGYGRNLTCPPYSPTPDVTQRILKEYEWGILMKIGEDLNNTRMARPSMEACSIDVFVTVKNAGFEIRVLTSRNEVPTCYALLLVT